MARTTYRTPSDIQPTLTYDDALAAIEWLCRAFGFTKQFVVPGEGTRVEHSELSLGTGVVMVGSPMSEDRRVSPRGLAGSAHALSVYVPDPDAHHPPWAPGRSRLQCRDGGHRLNRRLPAGRAQ